MEDFEAANSKSTLLEYLNDTYAFESRGRLVGYGSDSRGSYVLLDATIFYPQGGGQPSDRGEMRLGQASFSVDFARLVEGKVRHYIKDEERSQLCRELVGQELCLHIDEARRLANAKSHTGGHLLADIVEGLSELKAIKAYHFPDGPYVEFSGKLHSLAKDDLASQIEAIARRKIEDGALVTAWEGRDSESIGPEPRSDGKTRHVQIEGYKAGLCGGTHIRSLSELKELRVRKIQYPKENTRVCYWTS